MATEVVRDWHRQQKAEEDARVAIRIQSGTKASNNLAMGRRMMNRTFKGYVPNASGVGQRPFFINKDEANTPLESKVAMRGGVLSTPAGQTYAKKILARRAVDVRNQENLEAGLPQEPSSLIELNEVESRTMELNQLMTSLIDYVSAGEDIGSVAPDYRNLVRLIISLAPTFTNDDVAFISQWADNISNVMLVGARNEREDNALGRPERANRENRALQTLIGLTEDIKQFLEEIGPYMGADPTSKARAIKTIAKKVFGGIPKASAGTLVAQVAEEGAVAEDAGDRAQRQRRPPRPGGVAEQMAQQREREQMAEAEREDRRRERPRRLLPPPPPPANPAPRRPPIPEDMRRDREAQRRALEQAEINEAERARAQRRGPEPPRALPINPATYVRTGDRERDGAFVRYIQQLWADGNTATLDRIATERRAQYYTLDKSKTQRRGAILRKAGFEADAWQRY